MTTVKETLSKLSKYTISIGLSKEKLDQMDSSHTVLEFVGNPEIVYKKSSNAIKQGLCIQCNEIYVLLFANEKDRVDYCMKAIPMEEISSLNIEGKYGAYFLPEGEGKQPVRLILIFERY